jgi:hypothetical protein
VNLFYLDKDHDTNARYHVDKHVVKMILEAAEMLCQCHWVEEAVGFVPRQLNKEELAAVRKLRAPYKDVPLEQRPIPYLGYDTHLNHPSTIWVRSSFENYAWTYCYMEALEAERKYRNPNGVPSHRAVDFLRKHPLPNIPDVGFTKFALAMNVMREARPDLVNEDDPIWSYRNFYHLDKATFASWKAREKPPWWDEGLANYTQRLKK